MTQNIIDTSAPETILLAVTGMSPAVITETVWALATAETPILPDRVIAVTTTAGRARIEQQLFQPLARFEGISAWDALRAALKRRGLDPAGRLGFGNTNSDIRVITGTDPDTGRSIELEDLRSLPDNDAAADYLLEQVRSIVENPDTRLIASLAGGRKTMGALLYACMTLVGRESDRLTHVLVNEPFETVPEFFFPGQPGGALADRQGRFVEAASAALELADVPFVPLRNLFVRELGRKAGTFSRLVASCREQVRQRAAENLRLSIDVGRTEIDVNGQPIRLSPLEHLLFLFLARRAKQADLAYGTYVEAVDDLNAFRLHLLETIPANQFGDWRHNDSLRSDWDDQEIRKAVSGIKKKLRQNGTEGAALASCLPEKGRCSLDLPGELIFIKG